MSLLACEGNFKAVYWLKKSIPLGVVLDSGQAVIGYAMGGYHQKVNELLEMMTNARSAVYTDYNPHAPYAVHGYAMGGMVDKVNYLLTESDNLKTAAVIGYCAVGNFEQIELLGYSIEEAIELWTEHNNKINKKVGILSKVSMFMPKISPNEPNEADPSCSSTCNSEGP